MRNTPWRRVRGLTAVRWSARSIGTWASLRFLVSTGQDPRRNSHRSPLSLSKQGAAVDQATAPCYSSPLSGTERGQGVRTSRRLRRLTTARPGLGLVLGLERSSHIACTLPRSHQLGMIADVL